MPQPDRARAELAARPRASAVEAAEVTAMVQAIKRGDYDTTLADAFPPERQVMEGELYDADTGAWDLRDRTVEGERLGNLLFRLEGKRVRISIEVLPPEGDAE